MEVPSPHPREAERLAALRAMGLLDAPGDEALDALTETVRRLFDVPMAFISLVDAHRQWILSRQGLEIQETRRDVSFCGHTILQERVFAVEDATRDPRFSDNPLVAGDPHLRFYAGVPLRGTEGLPYGTLCVLSREPRPFSLAERELLEGLGLVAERLLHEAAAHTKEAEARLSAIIGNLAEGIVFQDPAGRILTTNPAARAILGLSEAQLHGITGLDRRWKALHADGSPWPEEDLPAMQALRSGEPCLGQVMGVHKPDGSLSWILVNAMPIRVAGRLTGVACSLLDLSPFRETEGHIRRYEERFEAVARNVPGVVYRFVEHPNGAISFPYVGDQIEAMYGITAEAWRANPVFALDSILPEDRGAYEAAHAKATAALSTFQWEGRTRTARPGELKWIRCQSSPSRLPDGSLQWDGFIMDLTPMRQAEEAFRRQAAYQEAVFASAQVAIIATDLEGTVTSLNPFALGLLGYRSEELLGKATPALWHDPAEVAARAAELSEELGHPVQPGFDVFVQQARQGAADQREWTYLSREGRRIPVWLTVNGIYDGQGGLMGFLGIATDLSEQRQSESAYRLLAECTTDLIARHSPEGRFTFVTPACERMLGYAPEELIGRPSTDLVLPEDVPQLAEVHAAVQAGASGLPFRYRVRHRDGRILWLESTGNPLQDPAAGGACEAIYTSRDITEQVAAEEALRESEARSQALLSALPDMVLRLDAEGRVLDAQVPEDFIVPSGDRDPRGHSMREFLPEAAAEMVTVGIRQALEDRQPGLIEIQVPTPGGLRDHEIRIHPSGSGEAVFLVRDITDRKAVDRMKGEFVATVSHELRTPITAIRGALGLLEAGVGGEIPGSARELLDLARANTERLLRLVNDILDFEKAEGGQLLLTLEPQDLRPLVEATVAAAGPYATSLGVAYRWAPPDQAALAKVDGLRFQQIVSNLLSNAAKYSPHGGVVEVRLFREGAHWRVEVENRGQPIPEAFRPRVFERFAMADATDSRHRGGTGLGLAISRALVQRMGGEIDFTSDSERTCFFLRFPVETTP